jgi:hypothetical protein
MHQHQALRIPERERLQQDGVDDGEHRGVGADAEGQSEDGEEREAGRSSEQPERVPDVPQDRRHRTISSFR